MLSSLGIDRPAYLVANAYYASAKIILPLIKAGQHLVTSAKTNSVAYEPADKPPFPRRGRLRFYGRKVKLKQLFNDDSLFTEATSPIYGERNVTLRYHVVDLLWRPVGIRVRFVLVIHPERGRKILLSTALSLAPILVLGFAPFDRESCLQNKSLLLPCATASRYFSGIRPKTIPL